MEIAREVVQHFNRLLKDLQYRGSFGRTYEDRFGNAQCKITDTDSSKTLASSFLVKRISTVTSWTEHRVVKNNFAK